MPAPLSAAEVLSREFLDIRCKILDLAAALDRLDRAGGSVGDDPRMARIREAIDVVIDERSERAEHVQLVFSRAYDEAWRGK